MNGFRTQKAELLITGDKNSGIANATSSRNFRTPNRSTNGSDNTAGAAVRLPVLQSQVTNGRAHKNHESHLGNQGCTAIQNPFKGAQGNNNNKSGNNNGKETQKAGLQEKKAAVYARYPCASHEQHLVFFVKALARVCRTSFM